MFKRRAGFVLLVISLLITTGVMVGAADDPAPWLSQGSPSVSQTLQLAPNVLPSSSNSDCIDVTTRSAGESDAMHDDCVTITALGQVGSTGIIFNGATEIIPVNPPVQFFGLDPIPEQAMLVTHTSASPLGIYMHFYRSILDKLKLSVDLLTGNKQYTITQNPDFTLRDANGKSLPVNPYALAYSPNGSWMVVDSPARGLLRINMATFEIIPFGPSLNQPGDYASYSAQLAITNDGRYVAVKPNNLSSLVVYDVQTCSGAVIPVDPNQPKCLSRDYWTDLNSKIPTLRAIYQPRFVNNVQLSFTATYQYQAANNFQVAEYTLTAPGQTDVGIDYLGMGDSFAAGQGAFNYVDGTDTANDGCHLSSQSYPLLISSSLFTSGHSVACSGAKTRDILENPNKYEGQVEEKAYKSDRDPALISSIFTTFLPGYFVQTDFIDQYHPQAVTLSIGGNDVGFADIVKSCVMPNLINGNTCWPTYEDQLELNKRINNVFDKLQRSYKLVKKPGKRVYVVGYPQIVAANGNCAANVHLDQAEIELAISVTNQLNQVVQKAAESAGVYYVDVTNALAGYRLCENKSSQAAVNGLTVGNDAGAGNIKVIGAESYHPNAVGHDLLRRAILAKTNNLTAPMPRPHAEIHASSVPETNPSTDLPHTGRAIKVSDYDDGLSDDVLIGGQSTHVTVDSATAVLKNQTNYTVELGPSSVSLGTTTTNATGQLSVDLTVPPGTPAGFYNLHIYGVGLADQPIDIFKTVYVAANPDDYNGDGVPNTLDPCVYITPSGQDVDNDNVDDACDSLVSEPPSGPPIQVHLTDNSITASRP